MAEYFHSVTLDKDKCRGCINCIKRCPTEAIRVRNGKAKIIKERCIDCGECIRVCPYSAKTASTDEFETIHNFKYTVALPAPSFYGQFKKTSDVNLILNGLLEIGFDDIFEVARAADIVTEATRDFLENYHGNGPIIGSACPACLRLIKIRFPSLIDNILPILSPMDVAAKIARKEAVEKTGLKPEEIGIFFISPCAAKVTSVKAPFGTEKVEVDGVLSMKNIYTRVVPVLSKLKNIKPLAKSSPTGIGWAKIGGESSSLKKERFISVDGIDNVIGVLEELDNNQIEDIQFIELNACVGGCVGGPLTIENTFVAKQRIAGIKSDLSINREREKIDYKTLDVGWNEKLEYSSIMQLDSNIFEALKKMDAIKEITRDLPGLDCGSCGAPSCQCLAEDIVRGFANESDCIFKLRERVRDLANEMMELEEHMPPPFQKEEKRGK